MQSPSQIVNTNKWTPSFFTGWMTILSLNQQCQSTEDVRDNMEMYIWTQQPYYDIIFWKFL